MVILTSVFIIGCKEDVMTFPELSKAKVRFINTLSSTESVKIVIDSTITLNSIYRGQYSAPIDVNSGSATRFEFFNNADKSILIPSQPYTFPASGQYFVFLNLNPLKAPTISAPIPYLTTSPFQGKPAIQFFNYSRTVSGKKIVITMSDIVKVITPDGIKSSEKTDVLPMYEGKHSLLIHEQDNYDTFLATVPILEYTPGKVYTIYIYDLPGISDRVGVGIFSN